MQLTDDLYDLATESAADSAAVEPRIVSQSPAEPNEPPKRHNEKTSQKPLLAGPCEVLLNEADGNRTRNLRIDSPVL